MLTYRQALQKGLQKPIRNKAYLNYVASLPCVVTGIEPAGEAHHIIAAGFGGGMGTKASDLFVFPLCREEHMLLHADVDEWEDLHGSQWMWIALTLHEAFTSGVFDL